MSELRWICVPGGTDAEKRPLLRVLVVPMLDGPDLSASGMASWPPAELLQAPALSLEWRSADGGAATSTEVAPADVGFEVVPDLWSRFFPPEMEVGGGRERLAPPKMAPVQPSSATAEKIAATFQSPAAVDFGPAGGPPPDYATKVHGGLSGWSGEKEEPVAPLPPPRASGDCPPEPGFHRVVSLLREHPAVLRALGLIFDLRVFPPAGLETTGQVRVLWPGAPPAPAIVSPWTIYGAAFLPFSRSGAISRGMVTLTPDPTAPDPAAGGGWALATVDVEGGARKLRDAAQALPAVNPGEDLPPPRLPAMRSAGIQLLRVGREEELARRRGRAEKNHARGTLEDLVLDADDLVLGYRVDIRTGGGEWRSLHERTATYSLGGPDKVIGAAERLEEGHVKANGAARDSDDNLRMSEMVARWSGWSLAVQRPPFDAPGGATRAARRDCLPFEFAWTFEVPAGSLPRLRFAETYAVRARVADMAGGGLAHDDPAAKRCAISEQGYRRYEPVPSPSVLLGDGLEPSDLGPGEGVDCVVVRSTPGEADIDAFAAHNPGYTSLPRRSLHRPHTSLAMAEQHQMLDEVDDGRTFEWLQRALAVGAAGSGKGEGPLPDPAASGVGAASGPEPWTPAAFDRRDWGRNWPEPDSPKSLELREPEAGKPVLIWEGETLALRLPAGRQITLALSSTVTADFLDHFELHEAMPSGAQKAVQAGRHPLITPARALTLVHAVRKPIKPPDPAAKLAPQQRQPGQSFALLNPEPLLLGLDAESTAQLDVSGAWVERRDDAVDQISGASVDSIAIDRGATELKQAIHHEFGDSRHRDVTYTLTAVSRFRRFFKTEAEEAADPLAFSERRPLRASVSIPSTARPPAPIVLATRPGFVWEESGGHGSPGATLRRRRLGGRLRVELARPWFETGDGERLAVIVWDRSGGLTPPDSIAALVTEAGRDPIWDTPSPERWPTEAAFSGAAGAADEVRKAALAIPFDPWFDGDRWCADIGLPGIAASSYCPFVRLGLARYQAASIADHHLSPIVLAEMTQLLPDRTLSVTQTGAGIEVDLDGLGPAGPRPNRVDLVLEHCQPGAGGDAGMVELSALAGTEVPAWVPLPGGALETELGADPVAMPLPADLGPLRLRVREVELIGADAGAPPSQAATAGELNERVVFTDTVALPLG